MEVEADNHVHYRLQFAYVSGIFQLLLFILFIVCLEYGDGAKESDTGETDSNGVATSVNEVDHYYPFYQDVHVMIFVGFGFLMTFLKKYGFSAIGYNFVLSALTIQWAMVAVNYMHNLYEGHENDKIKLDITKLITADFACGAILITFGAVLGKVTPTQMVVVVFLEILVYGANELWGATHLQAVDMGGSIFVHTFGAYFGLALSRTLTKSNNDESSKLNSSTPTSDLFAMIGTLFLWMFWPSFNGALALQSQQHRVIINTVIAICGSCFAAFIADCLMRPENKFDMVSIQNATLAGGVAVGSSSDLVIQPWGALLIGICAGVVSVAGYVHISPFLSRTIGLDDTCGVHNLHGIPGIIGGIGGAISAATASNDAYGQNIGFVFPARAPEILTSAEINAGLEPGEGRSAKEQAYFQLAALVSTLLFAIIGGIITGWIIKHPFFLPPGQKPSQFTFGESVHTDYWYNDHFYWEVPEDDEDNKYTSKHARNKELELIKNEKHSNKV